MRIPRNIRITILLFILFLVGADAWLSKMRSTDWKNSLWVVVYPVAGDESLVTDKYISSLDKDVFEPIEWFVEREAKDYEIELSEPFYVEIAPPVQEMPPIPPEKQNIFTIVWWSLKMRVWANKNDNYDGPPPDLRIFVIYWKPADKKVLPHSFGLEKGMVGVAHAFASVRMASRNNVIIAHELLHMLGATDKYDLTTLQPIYPVGFADPDRKPLYPQDLAEIMAGRIPLSETKLLLPGNLHGTVIGLETAREINWIP